jgi:hypothetical protein
MGLALNLARKSSLLSPGSLWIRKYGAEAFKLICTVTMSAEEDMHFYERGLIKLYRTTDRKHGYNRAEGGEGGGMRGKHLSAEHRRRLSEANVGKVISEEQRRLQSQLMQGNTRGARPCSEEKKRKIGQANTGNKSRTGQRWSAAQRQKHRETIEARRAFVSTMPRATTPFDVSPVNLR